jgi:hypothetical protein
MGKRISVDGVSPIGLRLALSLLALLAPALLLAYEWDIEFVDRPRQFDSMSDHSAAIDGVGHLHAVYGKDNLYHAWHDGTTWHFEIVDEAPQVGEYASLALGAEGCPRISYYDGPEGNLKFASKDASGWHIETVDTLGDVGRYTSTAVGPDEAPHITYCEGHMAYDGYLWYWVPDALKHAWCDAAGWHTELIDSVGFWVGRNSLCVDAQGAVHVSYHGGTGPTPGGLNYARKDSLGWEIEELEGEGWDGAHNSLAVDTGCYPRIAFGEWLGGINYTYKDTSGWHTEPVGTEEDQGGYLSLVLSSDTTSHISCWNYSRGLWYARRDSTGWHIETADSTGGSGEFTSLALDTEGRPRIAYYVDRALRCARKDESGWHSEAFDQERWAGQHTSLVLDAEGRPSICYHASIGDWYPGRGYLKRAWRDDSSWHTEAVDSGSGDAGRYSSVAASNGGTLHVAYCTGLNVYESWYPVDLKYACHDGVGWQVDTVDTYIALPWDGVGDNNSIAVDSEGIPHVSYRASTRYRYATRNGSAWYVETISSGGASNLGACTSIALDADGFPHVCFREVDSPFSSLKYTYKDPVAWHTTTVDSSWDVGAYASLALDGSDSPHISYYDGSLRALRYARMTELGWHIETVDSIGDIGQHTSLALDGVGYAHVSYYDETSRALKYAYQGPCGWTIQTVDGNGFVGKYSSIAVPRRGEVHISYYDEGGDDLKYARGRTLVLAEDQPPGFPTTVRLLGVTPNPVIAGEVTITCSLAGSGSGRPVSLKIYDPLGRLVAVPFTGTPPPGTHSLEWDLLGRGRVRLSPGVYTLRLETAEPAVHDARRLVLVR